MIRFNLNPTESSCWGLYPYFGDRIQLLLVLKYHTSSQHQSCMDFADLLPILLVYVQYVPNGTILVQLSYHEQLWAWHCTSGSWICVFSTLVHHHPHQDCIFFYFFFCVSSTDFFQEYDMNFHPFLWKKKPKTKPNLMYLFPKNSCIHSAELYR